MTIERGAIATAGVVIVGAILWSAFSSTYTESIIAEPNVEATTTEAWLCNGDGFICPDGSTVGRTGPTCQFAACPPANATSSTITAFLGGRATGLNVTINPREVVSDSRCPQGAQCIWAGTVEVRAAVSTEVAHGEHVFTLGEGRIFGDFLVTLVQVTPARVVGEVIPDSSYRFVFEVHKR